MSESEIQDASSSTEPMAPKLPKEPKAPKALSERKFWSLLSELAIDKPFSVRKDGRIRQLRTLATPVTAVAKHQGFALRSDNEYDQAAAELRLDLEFATLVENAANLAATDEALGDDYEKQVRRTRKKLLGKLGLTEPAPAKKRTATQAS